MTCASGASAGLPESDFQRWFEAAPEPYLVCSGDRRVLGGSDACFRLLQVSRADWVGKFLPDLLAAHPSTDFWGAETLQAALASAFGQTRVPEPSATAAQPQIVLETIHVLPIAGSDYFLLRFELPSPISHPRQPMEQLRPELAREGLIGPAASDPTEQRHRRILDGLPSFVSVLTPDGIVLDTNRAALDMTGLQPEDVLGQPLAKTHWWSHTAEGQEQLQRAIAQAAAGQSRRYDTHIRGQGNRLIAVDFSLAPLFNAAGVEYLIASGIDITERKQARDTIQQQLTEIEAIYDTAPIGLTLLDHDLRFVRLNQRLAEINGLSVKAHLGRSVREIVPALADQVEPLLRRVLTTGEPLLNLEVVGETASQPGVERIWNKNWYPLRDTSGTIVGINAVVEEVTDRKRAEAVQQQMLAQEQAAREAAEAANRTKDEFLAVVSHELRTPLNPILGWSQLLLSRRLDEAQTQQALETIFRNARAQTDLIDDLLDVSRILRGKLSLQMAAVELQAVVQAAIETVRLAAQAKAIAIHTPTAAAGCCVLGDAGRLQQVFWNLLSNAVKFTPTGGQVDIHLQTQNQHVQITVTDTGKGIPASFLPYVFDRFRQEESDVNCQFGGLGLGLAIVRHLVELHGGSVEVASPGEGRGATFTVTLPLLLSPAASCAVPPVPPLDLSGLRVLAIDDNADALALVTILLEQVGAEVVSYSSPQQALDSLTQAQLDIPDIIVSDIGMPEMDGYALMRRVRSLPAEQGGQVPAIALTAYASEIDHRQALAAGFQRHIAKPVDPSALIAAIATLVNARAADS